ncbi:MAG: FHA domain-containing serine/threonine-protein kinase [Gemmataceae bacterium]
MGAVYLAHDTVLDRPVAVKIPRQFTAPEAAARFLREAQAAARLRHPNICPTYDAGQADGTHYLTMQYIPGEPLAHRVGRDRPLPPAEAARVVRVIAEAMHYAHEEGVVHRDLKPANVMLDDRGEPVVMDFGLARRAGDPRHTSDGTALGTPAYMPPEQLAGDTRRVGPWSDVYSLGAVLYELLTGQPPFTGDLFALLAQIPADPPAPPTDRRPGLDRRFDDIALRALAKDPAGRWASMRALADALAPLAGGTAAPGWAAAPAGGGPVLTLRVAGTPFAYRPPAGAAAVTVGRQRRKPGDPPDVGNDFVLRVAGNEPLSARISRRHFEVRRTPAGFAVVDLSKAGLTRNGQPVPKGVEVPLADGDVLGVAGVATLEVRVTGPDPSLAVAPGTVVEVPAPADTGGGQVQFEASLGDVVTAGG